MTTKKPTWSDTGLTLARRITVTRARAVAVATAIAAAAVIVLSWAGRSPADAQGLERSPRLGIPPGVPTLVSTSSPSVTVGQAISDATVISGGNSPTGNATFALFGPGDPLCVAPPLFSSTIAVKGGGRYQSAAYLPVTPGIYRWITRYSGDSGNLPVQGTCNTGGQAVAVTADLPAIVTMTTPAINLGGSVTDSAAISGTLRPTGTLIFKLFGPGDNVCVAAPAFVSAPLPVNGNGTYLSPPFTPAAPGPYRFTVEYSGDGNHSRETSRCEAGSQVVAVERSSPTIAPRPSPSVSLGQAVVAKTSLTGTVRPTGAIVYSFFRPGDDGCSAMPLFISSGVPVTRDGIYQSPPFTPTEAGRYPFVATYGGDANNAIAASECASGGAALEVTRAALTMSGDVSAPVPLGGAVVGTDILSGGHAPTGTIVFSFFRPDDPSCRAKPVFASPPVPVAGDGRYNSLRFIPSAPGTYHFIAVYSGDANNLSTMTTCSALNQAIEVKDDNQRGRKFIALEVSAFALLAVVGASGTGPTERSPEGGPEGTPDSQPGPSGGAPSSDPTLGESEQGQSQQSPSQGSVIAVGIDNSEEGWEGSDLVVTEDRSREEESAAIPRAAIGDRSRTWRWPGTERLDRIGSTLPHRLAPVSPTLALILNDGVYARALLGSASALLPVIGVVLGVLAVRSTHGQALPPGFFVAMALAVLGVLDALAGFVGVAIFVVGVVALGGLTTFNDLRTILGLSALWFAAPLIAGTTRPLRRAPTKTPKEHWDRMADVVIGSLFGAWAVKQILQGLPGLAGVPLPIADKAFTAAVVVLAALAARLVLETIAAHWYPDRLRQVHRGPIPGSSTGQHLVAALLGVAIFIFVAAPYVGLCWQLWAGGALFVAPPVLRIYKDRFPNAPRVYAVVPQGILRAVVLLVVGGLGGAVVLNVFQDHPEQLLRDSFVLLSLPGFSLFMVDLLARDGETISAPHWLRQMMGTVVLTAGLLLVVGLVHV